MAWANDVVGGDDEECRFRAQTSDVFMVKGLIPPVYYEKKHASGKLFESILRFLKVLGVAPTIQSVQKLDTIMVQADDDAPPSSYEERRTLP